MFSDGLPKDVLKTTTRVTHCCNSSWRPQNDRSGRSRDRQIGSWGQVFETLEGEVCRMYLWNQILLAGFDLKILSNLKYLLTTCLQKVEHKKLLQNTSRSLFIFLPGKQMLLMILCVLSLSQMWLFLLVFSPKPDIEMLISLKVFRIVCKERSNQNSQSFSK